MIKRILTQQIIKSLKQFPAVGLIGSRQTGKTTLAREIAVNFPGTVFLDLERPSDLAKLDEPEIYLSPHADKLVILDEIQHKPNLFKVMRSLIDEKRRAGRFLILGSASSDLLKQSSESLAGRIIYHELNPLTIDEIGHSKFQTLWIRGGYPLSFLAKNAEQSQIWRKAFLRTYCERDLNVLGIKVSALQIQRFLQMIAHFHGQVWNHSKIAGSLGVTSPTAKHYLDILTSTFIVRQLEPFHINTKKRLVKSAKVYLRDSGLLHTLLEISDIDKLQGHPQLGASWEGFWLEQIICLVADNSQAYFYRTHAGAEMDLILVRPGSQIVAVEIKYTASPKITKGFYEAFTEAKCQRGYILYAGNERYNLAKNIVALPVNQVKEIIE